MRKIFIAAVAFLALVGCKENTKNVEVTEKNNTEVIAEGDLAFVNVDYVLAESDIFKGEGVALRNKTEKTQQKWAKKEQDLQSEINQLAEKYQKGLITTRNAHIAVDYFLQRRNAWYCRNPVILWTAFLPT